MHPLQIIGCLITAFAFVYLWIDVVGGWLAKHIRKRGASRYVRDYEQLLDLPHQLETIDPKDAKLALLDAFDSARDELSNDGFRHLADLENVTVSRVTKSRTFMRFLISDDELVLAWCYQDTIAGSREQAVFVAFFTFLTNDDVLETGVDSKFGRLFSHPKIHAELVSEKTNVWAMLNIHRNRLRDFIHEHAGVEARSVATVEQLTKLLASRDLLLKESIAGKDVMLDQLKSAGADAAFIDEVTKRRSA